MAKNNRINNLKNNNSKSFLFFLIVFNFIVIVGLVLYIIYLRFIPYTSIEYGGYAVSGKEISANLFDTTFNVSENIKALAVNQDDEIYKNLKSFYVGASKENSINIDFPIFVNNSIALYNLSSDVKLITNDFQEVYGYKGFTLTSGALYNSDTLERADYFDYILMKNSENIYINTKEIKIKTYYNEYIIPINSLINISEDYITYYILKDEMFIYNKILDVDSDSIIKIEDYDFKYKYKDFLIGLQIIKDDLKNNQKIIKEVEKEKVVNEDIKENKKKEENKIEQNKAEQNKVAENKIEENKEEENKTEENKIDENISEENKIEENVEENKVEENIAEEENKNNIPYKPGELKWIKPEVTCEGFEVSIYSAKSKVKIYDPRGVINKAVTFTFYKDDKLAFRTSVKTSKEFEVTKLLPECEYSIIGTYQYKNEAGTLIEKEFFKQDIKTGSTSNLNYIDLSIKNGQIYPTKIELEDIHITSDINDEAIKGVKNAEIRINRETYKINTNTLKDLLKGEEIKYQSSSEMKSNRKYEYEIIFYDTANNKMKLTNNTGNTLTSKNIPIVRIDVSNQNIISTQVAFSLYNEDNIDINNYKYILYKSTGEVFKKDYLPNKDTKIVFEDLDPKYTYIIKVYADFDIEDGKGLKLEQEIGNAVFSTLPLSKLGSLKFNVNYNEDTDITFNSGRIKVAINSDKSDERLIQILDRIIIKLQDESKNVVKEILVDDLSNIKTEDGMECIFDNLNSNTIYNIQIEAYAKQGSSVEIVQTSYTINKFITNKKAATFNVSNLIVTTNLIDMDIYIDDVDNSIITQSAVLRLYDSFGKEYLPIIEPEEIRSNTLIPTNQSVRLTYNELKEDTEYSLICEAEKYNETSNNSKIKNNYQIDKKELITSGLGGNINLKGLIRKRNLECYNLIDIKSENNWYSECFNVIKKSYIWTEENGTEFKIDSKYNYGKTYTEDENSIELKLLSNQCYVYDFKDYIGQEVTISCLAKTTNENAKVYLQKGKNIGINLEEISNLSTSNWNRYEKTLKVPDDGYLGFYLEKAEKELEEGEVIVEDYYLQIKNLQVELGNRATEYNKFEHKLYATINVDFIDEKHITYDELDERCKYFIRVRKNNTLSEFDYTYDSYEKISELYEYLIEETNEEIHFEMELIIRQYGREYVLDLVEFNYIPEECTEIKEITSIEEYKEIQPYGNYIIASDLNFRNVSNIAEYTFGSPTIPFYGSIDFNGKTIEKATFDSNKKRDCIPYLFYKLESTATIKNIVINYYINTNYNRFTTKVNGIDEFIAEEDGLYSLFLYNSGNIDNIIINLKQCTEKEKLNVALMGYKNSGTIENFIVKFEVALKGSKNLAGVCLYSDGIVQNGYLYGEGIEGIGKMPNYESRNIAGVIFQMEQNALLQNVYNISTIRINHYDLSFSYGAYIVYNLGVPPEINEQTGAIINNIESKANVKNVYSVNPIVTTFDGFDYYNLMDNEGNEVNDGPNILNSYSKSKSTGSRYFADLFFNESPNNIKYPVTSLYEPAVQDNMLNTGGYNSFIIDNLVKNGYYPQLKLNYNMPKQENIVIDITGTDIIDILSAEVIENNDVSTLDLSEKVLNDINSYISNNNVNLNEKNTKIAEVRVYNPSGTTISSIDVNYLDANIMGQGYKQKVTTMYVLLDNPTSYLNTYNVAQIKARKANGREIVSNYSENSELGTRSFDATFIKDIANRNEWNQINNEDENGVSGLIQNYRLVADLDFANSEVSPYIEGIFEGYLDGKSDGVIHTLKNIEGDRPLINELDGTFKNINIDRLTINTNSQYAGLIGKCQPSDNLFIENIHIKDMEVNSKYSGSNPYIGGIVAYFDCGSSSLANNIAIQNCGINNFSVEFENQDVMDVIVGGIVGYIYIFGGVTTNIQNNFVQNFNVEANVYSTTGIGGIVGRKSHGTDQNVKTGVPYIYIKNCYTSGKINTRTRAGGILGTSVWGNSYINNCYSTINFNSTTLSGSAYIGGIAGNFDTGSSGIINSLYLGNIYVSGNNVANVNRIMGNDTGTSNYNNYAYKDQLINGEPSTKTLGATKLLTYNEIFNKDTYLNKLDWDQNFAYIIKDSLQNNFDLLANECLLQLNDTDGKLQTYQDIVVLDTDLKLESIQSVPSADKTKVDITMKFENKKNLELTGVKIENDDMNVIEDSWQTTTDEQGYTTVTFTATPNRAYDSYKIERVYYFRNGQNMPKDIQTKIKVELYNKISNAREWNEFFEGEGKTYPGQNVKIVGNIDFTQVDHIAYNVVVGRIEAEERNPADRIQISNANLTLGKNQGLINEIKTSMKNINFQKFTITDKGDYVGIVCINRGEIKNCSFDTINIQTENNARYSYIGIFSRCMVGSFNNISINNVYCYGSSYVGGLCGQTTSLGSSSEIHGTYISIDGAGDYVGGLIGRAQGKISNITAYQYEETGKKASDKKTEFLVEGRDQVGGCIGRWEGGYSGIVNVKNTNSTIKGRNYVGGNIGYTSGTSNTLISENNSVNCTGNYIGGNVGYSSWYGTTLYISNYNKINGITYVGGNIGGRSGDLSKLTSTDNIVTGTTNVGGNIGTSEYYSSTFSELIVSGSRTQISGKDNVGGSLGYLISRLKYIKVTDANITGTGNDIGGIVGKSVYTNTSIPANNSTNYTIVGVYAKGLRIIGEGNNVGGIAGNSLGTIYAAVVEDCIINSNNGNNAGGIAGYYTGYGGTSGSQLSSSNYYLWHSYCINSEVKAKNNAGGIVGKFIFGNIQYTYTANTNIMATNTGAGGIVGYFDNSKLNNLQYKGTIKYNYVANVDESKNISANNSVGGLVGILAKNLNYDEDIERYNNIECNLIVTDLSSYNNFVSFGAGSINNTASALSQSQYMNNIYVYNCSYLNGVQVGLITKEADSYKLITSEDLNKNSTYTKNTAIKDEEGETIGYDGLNFGTSRYVLNSGYFPILTTTYSNATTYWASNYLNIIQSKIPIPNRTIQTRTLTTSSLNTLGLRKTKAIVLETLPETYLYPVDIDKINIEFSKLGETSTFSVFANNEAIIENQKIDSRVYTLKYDFKTPLHIITSNVNYIEELEFEADEIQNTLAIKNNEYFYLLDNNLYSNKRTFDGEYVNIFNNKALDMEGNMFELSTMDLLENGNIEIQLLDDIIPISNSEFENNNILTFYHCTKIVQDDGEYTFKDNQLFVKDNKLYLIDGKLKNKGNSVIINSYNDNQYEATLGTDGVIYDLLSKINYPDNFKNKDIVQMTNNLNQDTNIVLVGYSDGNIRGFNYITGEEVYNNNIGEKETLIEYVKDNFSLTNLLYEIKTSDYEKANNLIKKLEKISVEDAIENANDEIDYDKKEENILSKNNEISSNNYNNTENNIKTSDFDDKIKENSENENKPNYNSNDSNNSKVKNNSGNTYITAYEPISQSYVIYNTKELFSMNSSKVSSENEKIKNNNLINFYSNVSVNKYEIRNIGVILITIILSTIGIILIIMYKKSNR